MILGRVVGTTVATVKHPVYEGCKVLIVVPIDPEGRPRGTAFLAVDSVQAGEGDAVLVAREGNAARQVLGSDEDPFHSVVLGIVDRVDAP